MHFKYALDREEYTLCNALLWQNFRQHCKKAVAEGEWNGRRFIHIGIVVAQILPVVSQIASLLEMLIVLLGSKKAGSTDLVQRRISSSSFPPVTTTAHKVLVSRSPKLIQI